MNKKQAITSLGLLMVAVILVGGALFFNNQNTNEDQQQASSATTTTNSTTAGNTPAQNSSSGSYKAGSYSATGEYQSPDGAQKIVIRLTIGSDGTVTDTSATSGANGSESREHQADFIADYKTQVVGKNIDSISLSHVSGSSLTPEGFNDALDKIKQQAEA